MSRRSSAIPVLTLFALALACGAPSEAPDGPETAVQQFYLHLNEGSYDDAKRLYNEATLAVVGDPEITPESVFDEWAQGETKSGIISEVEIVGSTVEEATANVEYEIVYDDGSRVKRSVEVTQEEGHWRLGFISS